MGIRFWSCSLSLRLCYLPVNWTGPWILPVSCNIWLQLSKLCFQFSPTLWREITKDKDCPQTSVEGTTPNRYPDSSPNFRTLNIGFISPNHKGLLQTIKLYTNWRSKIKTDWIRSSPETNTTLKYKALLTKQIKIFITNMKLYFACCPTTCFSTLLMHK